MKKKILKATVSAALAFTAVAAIPQSLNASAWARRGKEYSRTAGAYKVRQYFFIPFASESTNYLYGKNYNQGEIVTVNSQGYDQYGINLTSRGYLTDFYFYKLY